MELVLTSIHTVDWVNNLVVKNKPRDEEFYDYFSQILVRITNPHLSSQVQQVH